MNKEEIYDLLNRLDLQEWCTELYKVPLTWCELYDIRDYIINLEQQVKKQKEIIDKSIEWVKDWTHGANDWFEEDSKPSELLDILKEVE